MRCVIVSSLAISLLSFGNRGEAAQPLKVRKPTVRRVIDGDTFVLTDGAHVRLVGVDTPELERGGRPVQYYAEEARKFLTGLVQDKKVTLKIPWPRKDKYGRTLAYLYLENGTFVNAEIIKQGYGFAYTKYPFEYMDTFREYQKQAMRESRGLWGRNLVTDGLKAIGPSEANKHYSERVIVQGKIIRTYSSRKACFLNFHQDWQHHLSVVIFAGSFYKFPDSPEKYYLNKHVKVLGKIREYRGAPEIILNNATEIQILK
jgi:micrococcal nuclease